MKGLLRARRKLALIAAGLATAISGLGVAAVALGTPGTGSVSATTLADVTAVNTVNMNVNRIKFRTKDPVRVVHIKNTGGPGFSSGWHSHTGPVVIAVTAGSLTFYDRADRGGDECRVTTVTAPGGYIETAGEPIQVLNTTPGNVNSGTAEWITTQIIPPGASTREDVTPGFCGV
jgi:hypothetical protein